MGDPEVHQAENGTEALEVLQTEGPMDFVLSDFRMSAFG